MATGGEEPKVVSLSGAPIFHHGPESDWQAAQGEMCLEQISDHIERHLGKVETVFHELVSDTVHIDVHIVKPSPGQPFCRLVTSGMSDLPMAVPDGSDAPRYAELIVTLPADWHLDQPSFDSEEWYWPIRLIKQLARLPHKHDTWLGFGHTIPNGDPAEPYAANTKLCGAIILAPASVPEDFGTLQIDESKTITFYAVVPLFQEEMDLKLRSGSDKLLDLFDSKGINDIIDPRRANVTRKRFRFF
jgi:hypothetical protein